MTDDRIARIERGVNSGPWMSLNGPFVLAKLRAWQEIAERHTAHPDGYCLRCRFDRFPCPDRQAADAAIDRLDALWGGESRG